MVKLYIGNLSWGTSPALLRELIQKISDDICDAEIVTDRTSGKSRGFGFVTVRSKSAAQDIVSAFHQQEIEGRRITAVIAEEFDDLVVTPEIIQIAGLAGEEMIKFFAAHPAELRQMDPHAYEQLIAEIWAKFGYVVELQKQTRDGGVDVIAIRDEEVKTRFLIQCKRLGLGAKVSVQPVRQLLGVKYNLGASKAIIATTGYFTAPAQALLDYHRWELEGKDYDGVVGWLKKAAGSESDDTPADASALASEECQQQKDVRVSIKCSNNQRERHRSR